MHSSSADWVFGEARLISSAITTLANTGPGRNSNSVVCRLKIDMPVMSTGIRSGVNCTRLTEQSIERRQRLGQRRLPDARHVLDEQVALGEQRDQRDAHDLGLADDHPLDVGGDPGTDVRDVRRGPGGAPSMRLLVVVTGASLVKRRVRASFGRPPPPTFPHRSGRNGVGGTAASGAPRSGVAAGGWSPITPHLAPPS